MVLFVWFGFSNFAGFVSCKVQNKAGDGSGGFRLEFALWTGEMMTRFGFGFGFGFMMMMMHRTQLTRETFC